MSAVRMNVKHCAAVKYSVKSYRTSVKTEESEYRYETFPAMIEMIKA